MASMSSRLKGALWGMYIGDALAMPVHWYYDRSQIFRDFGRDGITGYAEPMSSFPGSIMNLSNTGGGGRGSDKASIVGDVILHGKKKYWMRGGSYHYHHGMKAGDTTLDTLVAGIVLQAINKRMIAAKTEEKSNFLDACGLPSDNPNTSDLKSSPLIGEFLDQYIEFMTTPDSHNDIYAGTAHRMYFANHVKKVDKFACAGNDGHNTDSIDGLTNVVPVSLALIASGQAQLDTCGSALISQIINSTRKSRILPEYGDLLHELLLSVTIGQKELRTAILDLIQNHQDRFPSRYLNKAALDRFAATKYMEGDPMSACYIESNFPVLLLLAYKYADDPNQALLAGANAGGENVNRNAILGAIVGAAHGFEKLDTKLVEGLVKHEQYEKEIGVFVSCFDLKE